MPEVFGRETELAEIRRSVDRIPERPSALTLQGVAGIGKSTLWDVGLGYARELGFGFPRLPLHAFRSRAVLRGPCGRAGRGAARGAREPA